MERPVGILSNILLTGLLGTENIMGQTIIPRVWSTIARDHTKTRHRIIGICGEYRDADELVIQATTTKEQKTRVVSRVGSQAMGRVMDRVMDQVMNRVTSQVMDRVTSLVMSPAASRVIDRVASPVVSPVTSRVAGRSGVQGSVG